MTSTSCAFSAFRFPRATALLFAILFYVSGPAWGQVWIEDGDAPDGPLDIQDTVGTGELLEIRGSLDRGAGDHVDTYSIIVTDPDIFYASTSVHLGGSSTTALESLRNTRMWMWNQSVLEGITDVVLANDDTEISDPTTPPPNQASTISDPTLFPMLAGGVVLPTAQNVSLVAGEKYLLSISTFGNDPIDSAGIELATLDLLEIGLHGKNPAAGLFEAWENGASDDFGDYVIALAGARFCVVPEPASASLLCFGGLLMFSSCCRPRRLVRSK